MQDSDHNAGNGERCRGHVFEAFASTAIKTVYGIVAGYRLTAPDFHIGDGKYLAFTWCVPSLYRRRRTGEPKAGKGGGERRSGEEKRPGEEKAARGGKKTGEETTPKKKPARAADTRPV